MCDEIDNKCDVEQYPVKFKDIRHRIIESTNIPLNNHKNRIIKYIYNITDFPSDLISIIIEYIGDNSSYTFIIKSHINSVKFNITNIKTSLKYYRHGNYVSLLSLVGIYTDKLKHCCKNGDVCVLFRDYMNDRDSGWVYYNYKCGSDMGIFKGIYDPYTGNNMTSMFINLIPSVYK